MHRFITSILFVFLLSSCQEKNNQKKETQVGTSQTKTWTPPPVGEIVGQYEEKIVEDQLNNGTFKVVLKSTEESKKGIYKVMISFGANENVTSITFPNYGEQINVQPVLKKGNQSYHCLIGFKTDKEGFKEYYEVKVINKDIIFEQTKNYYIYQSQ